MPGLFDEIFEWLEANGYDLNQIIIVNVDSGYPNLGLHIARTRYIMNAVLGGIEYQIETFLPFN